MSTIEQIQDRVKERKKVIYDLQKLQEYDRDLLKKLGTEISVTAKKIKTKKVEAVDHTINVTDHALLRYLERVLHINVESYREAMVTDMVKNITKVLGGTGQFPNGQCALVLRDYHVVTVLTDELCRTSKLDNPKSSRKFFGLEEE